ncbi:hypothetical protein B9T33_07390 [Acinetobacter sp. ANC 5054]|nr:hypothetical protein B9T33_07390 [Acinetobacter sp. ANC 5054]
MASPCYDFNHSNLYIMINILESKPFNNEFLCKKQFDEGQGFIFGLNVTKRNILNNAMNWIQTLSGSSQNSLNFQLNFLLKFSKT